MDKYLFLKMKNWHLFLMWVVLGKISSYSICLGLIALSTYLLWIISIAYYGALKLKINEGVSWLTFKLSIISMGGTFALFSLHEVIAFPAYRVIEWPAIILCNLSFLWLLIVTGKVYHRLVEGQEQMNFFTYIKYISLFVVFIIGVWFIQPKINEIDFKSS
ncbi:MAG TPA: hypothetical protein VK174_08595 [Chitinophagales bacterium]|nr:hypothetical protein [Chitinophagales bacterium]